MDKKVEEVIFGLNKSLDLLEKKLLDSKTVEQKIGNLQTLFKIQQNKIETLQKKISKLTIILYIAFALFVIATLIFGIVCVVAASQPAYPKSWDNLDKTQTTKIEIQNQTQNLP